MVAPIRIGTEWTRDVDTIIDVRSPAEFAEDHIPGAINLPVLSDAERAKVGTIHKQISPFEARKLGASMAATNIARHIQENLKDQAAGWKPLVYCWRGGQRSGSMARILAEIGWVTTVLEGGYKYYRQRVSEELISRVDPLYPVLLQGPTGTAKTHILRAASAAGGQVLDLEGLACHRGSLLGAEPGADQPGQRHFESLLHQALCQLDSSRPVLIEAESSRIGQCHIPRALWQKMQHAPQILIKADIAARVEFLKRDYAHIIASPETLTVLIDGMVYRHGHAICDEWRRQVSEGDWDGLVTALITDHYDPAYQSSTRRRKGDVLGAITAGGLSPDDIPVLAASVTELAEKAVMA